MSDTGLVQAYTVASGIIVESRGLLLVRNRRRNGSHDWTTPGGVVDPGERVLEALQREVVEETAMVVDRWSKMLYSVDVDFVGREMTLHAEVYQATSFSGTLTIDDPDNVVVDGRWVDHAEAPELLRHSPQWVSEPLQHTLARIFGPDLASPADQSASRPCTWRYRVAGTGADFTAELVHFED